MSCCGEGSGPDLGAEFVGEGGEEVECRYRHRELGRWGYLFLLRL